MARIRTIKPEEWKRDSEVWSHGGGNLYVIQEERGTSIKIGVAGHPIRRLSQLQCGNSRKLYLRAVFGGTPSCCREIERYALRYFRASAGSEWVYAELDSVLQFLRAFEEEEGE